jgi:acyl-CoA thioesterase FadM
MEEAEHALWRAAGLSIVGDDLHWPRVTAYAEYKRPLRFEDEIEITVRAGFGRSRIQYNFEVLRGPDTVATGAMTSVCARSERNGHLKTIAIPLEVREQLTKVLR